ncbi:hypothetical protein JG559_11675 [Enterococcus faecalis]|uniref:Uncharacterized protein n=1 Tax=Enterococcus faecalis TaxID=1351 RepID=A0A974NZE9_ENTFL|nr:hypothetical protein JG559_11675 [Enterococcus faecalis]
MADQLHWRCNIGKKNQKLKKKKSVACKKKSSGQWNDKYEEKNNQRWIMWTLSQPNYPN